MTAKTPERLRRDAARECAEQLAVIVADCTWDAAETWLRGSLSDAEFSAVDLCLVLASMAPPDMAYRPVLAERFPPDASKLKRRRGW